MRRSSGHSLTRWRLIPPHGAADVRHADRPSALRDSGPDASALCPDRRNLCDGTFLPVGAPGVAEYDRPVERSLDRCGSHASKR
jgi:hypothetical protein